MEEINEPSRDAELDGMRIRQIAQSRRSCYRARSYALIGASACIVAIAQLVVLIFRQIHAGVLTMAIAAYGLMIPLCVFCVIFCFKRARKYREEAEAHHLPDPTTPPDFSTLSDGSQRWDDFDRIA